MPILRLENGHFAAVLGVRVRLGLALSFQARDPQFQLNELAGGEARRDRIKYPSRPRRNFIRNYPSIPQLPDLVGQSLVNEKGFYVDFGEHGQRMACLPGHVSP